MTKETLVERLRRTMQEEEDELSPEEREQLCILPGDSKRYRRMDLIAVKGNRVVIVEIDGEWHANEKQRRDDYERDRLVGMHWQNRCRLTHAEVTKNPSESFSKIMSHLDPSTGITQ